MINSINILKDKYFVYILECSDSTLYTGITNDPCRRIRMHNNGTASKYTKSRRPVKYVYLEESKDKSTALRRELEIKKMDRRQKLMLISDFEGSPPY